MFERARAAHLRERDAQGRDRRPPDRLAGAPGRRAAPTRIPEKATAERRGEFAADRTRLLAHDAPDRAEERERHEGQPMERHGGRRRVDQAPVQLRRALALGRAGGGPVHLRDEVGPRDAVARDGDPAGATSDTRNPARRTRVQKSRPSSTRGEARDRTRPARPRASGARSCPAGDTASTSLSPSC